mmetsp:Transcript_72965/g.214040  ORF Transcript_72965/g.214040 Transcript_72965/m.214040 type:complete len:239 (+) Transcript_72965:660-1376(+)
MANWCRRELREFHVIQDLIVAVRRGLVVVAHLRAVRVVGQAILTQPRGIPAARELRLVDQVSHHIHDPRVARRWAKVAVLLRHRVPPHRLRHALAEVGLPAPVPHVGHQTHQPVLLIVAHLVERAVQFAVHHLGLGRRRHARDRLVLPEAQAVAELLGADGVELLQVLDRAEAHHQLRGRWRAVLVQHSLRWQLRLRLHQARRPRRILHAHVARRKRSHPARVHRAARLAVHEVTCRA